MIDRDGMWDFLLFSIDIYCLRLSFTYYLLCTEAQAQAFSFLLFLFFSFLLHSESLQWSDVDHSLFSISFTLCGCCDGSSGLLSILQTID